MTPVLTIENLEAGYEPGLPIVKGASLTVNSGGVTTFGAAVGATKALGSLVTDAAGSTTDAAAGLPVRPAQPI